MKTIIIIFLLTLTSIYPQLTSFERVHQYFKAGSDIKTVSDGYILISTSNNNHCVVHTNQEGELDWVLDLPHITETVEYCSILQLQNSNDYFFVSSKNSNGGSNDLYICKISNTGNLLWSGIIDMGPDSRHIKSLLTEGDSLVILAKAENNLYFIKADPNGNLVSSNLLGALTLVSNWPNIEQAADSNFIVSYKGKLLKVNGSGQIIWENSINYIFYDLLVTPNSIFLSTSNNTITKFDLNGNFKGSGTVASSRALLANYGENIVVSNSISYDQSIFRLIDTNFSIIETKYLNGRVTDMSHAENSSVIISGELDGSLWMLKTDQNLEYTGVIFTKGYHQRFYVCGQNYQIHYASTNITSNLKLEYSTNNGTNWNLITADITPDSDSIEVNIPMVISDESVFRISSTANSDVYGVLRFKSAIGEMYSYIAGNEIKMWIANIGDGSHSPIDEGSGFLWPGGENATLPAIYEDGLLFGGMINGEPRINGNTHRQGVRPGVILNNGLPANPDSTRFVVWKLKSDWENLPPGTERDRYQLTYNNWPMDIGAPYVDVDGNGIFTPGIDHPDYIGNEVLYYVANDLDSMMSTFVYGTNPIGLEFQTTTFVFDRDDELDNVVYKKYRVINKGNNTVENMFLSYWHDIDLGDANDDRTGCDSTLNLAYVYNENEIDGIYGSPPPAVGYRVVQGPIVSATPQDSAFYNGSWRQGFVNQPTYAYYPYFASLGPLYIDPQQGIPQGSLESYNNMLGLHRDGSLMINPLTNTPTKFFCSGDPVAGTGWFEGPSWPGGPSAGDKRGLLSSGPFNFAPGDTQEIVIAICIARGTDRLNSITKLKNTSQVADNFFKSNYTFTSAPGNTIPLKYDLSQNYPNPFNPTTTIRFEIANPGNVELVIYNVLGQKVQTLINEHRNSGSYELKLNGNDLASGMYIYQLKSGDFISSKKMLMIK